MKVRIKSLDGIEETLSIQRVIVGSEGFYVIKDGNGYIFTCENNQPIKFNTASREGIGFFNGIEYRYIVEGFLNK